MNPSKLSVAPGLPDVTVWAETQSTSVASRIPLDFPAYRAWIRTQECVVCAKLAAFGVKLAFSGLTAIGIVECAHVGDHGKAQKCSDLETLPICDWHHRLSPDAHHVLGPGFWRHHNLDRYELIERHQRDFYAEAA